ncbi:hypothetical protein HYPSUDRAFT_47259 [Hypholoma sublateritium FD-334 SS-4]|uniref:Uncharacterized protein n=1 Tax=Hypholoma sublateritium (strain FD-334 SS-4) TaxID=945553 RepID=A0A0D2P863_HYPSF|nr:hypothetical protein HYPSUDRAFT_47259 [Hypholoma sublateritium FD-334 SS-4]
MAIVEGQARYEALLTCSARRVGASAHMTTEQILPLIVVTFIFIDISEYLHSYDYDVQLLCD